MGIGEIGRNGAADLNGEKRDRPRNYFFSVIWLKKS